MGNIFDYIAGSRGGRRRSRNDNSIPRQSPPPGGIAITPGHVIPLPRIAITPGFTTPQGNNQNNAMGPPPGGIVQPPKTPEPKYPDECCFMKILTEFKIERTLKKGAVTNSKVYAQGTGTCICLRCTSMDQFGNPDRATKQMLLNESSVGPIVENKKGTESTQIIKVMTLCKTGMACADDVVSEDGKTTLKETDCDGGKGPLKSASVSQKNADVFDDSVLGKGKLYDIDSNGNPVGIWVTLQDLEGGRDKDTISLGGRKKIKLKMTCNKAKGICD